MRSSRAFTITLLLAAGLGACRGVTDAGSDRPVVSSSCTSAVPGCLERVNLGAGRRLPVYRTHALATGDASVNRAVIVVHGIDRDADAYFNTMVQALRTAAVLDSVIVVAPHFQTLDDGPLADEPTWSSEGWKQGDLSAAESPLARISSFAAVDTLVRIFADRSRFPRLKSIVITGHSAGGQFTHRYAGTSPGVEGLSGLLIRFVVANPSTYLWLRGERPTASSFALPDTAACRDWNDWPYGLSNRNTYAKAADDATIRSRLTSRDVRILLGSADTLTSNLDMSCGGNLQGSRRYDRGNALVRFMGQYFPGNGHAQAVAPGIGHSSSGMYGSAAGQAALTSW